MLGKIEGRRRRGAQRMRWLDGITDSKDMSFSKFREMVKEREAWRAVVHGVTKSWTGLNNNNILREVLKWVNYFILFFTGICILKEEDQDSGIGFANCSAIHITQETEGTAEVRDLPSYRSPPILTTGQSSSQEELWEGGREESAHCRSTTLGNGTLSV